MRLVAALALLATPALAHPGGHGVVSLTHLVTEPDHLMMIALGAAALALAIFKLQRRS